MAYETESVIRSRRARRERFSAAAVTHESSIRVYRRRYTEREFACRKFARRNRSGLIRDWGEPLYRVSESPGIGSSPRGGFLFRHGMATPQPFSLSLSLSHSLFLSSNDLLRRIREAENLRSEAKRLLLSPRKEIICQARARTFNGGARPFFRLAFFIRHVSSPRGEAR